MVKKPSHAAVLSYIQNIKENSLNSRLALKSASGETYAQEN
jgi:hypothetical protein